MFVDSHEVMIAASRARTQEHLARAAISQERFAASQARYRESLARLAKVRKTLAELQIAAAAKKEVLVATKPKRMGRRATKFLELLNTPVQDLFAK